MIIVQDRVAPHPQAGDRQKALRAGARVGAAGLTLLAAIGLIGAQPGVPGAAVTATADRRLRDARMWRISGLLCYG